MTSDTNEPMPEPTDSVDPAETADTEGHSLLTIELARTASQERAREVAKIGRDGARAREAQGNKSKGGFFKRFGRS
jgi:hypothetical protein